MKHTLEVQVFISCPGDVTVEKNMIIEICESVSRTLKDSGSPVRFRPLDWRDIIAPIDGRPQEVINVSFSGYDIYIGILWMRFGTPPGAKDPITGKVYQSGTEEEFRFAQQQFEAGAKIEMYLFNKEPKATSSIAEYKQYGKVLKFQDKVKHLGWTNRFANKTESLEFANKIHAILNKYARVLEKELNHESKAEYLAADIADTCAQPFLEVTKFIGKAPKLEPSIPRSLVAYISGTDEVQRYMNFMQSEKLSEVIQTHKRVVILGSAGSGKSTELGNLAHNFGTLESPYVPVYQRLNTYVDEDIAAFLPKGWNEIPEENALIILDGLDEIQAQHFNTGVRKLLSFGDDHPNLRIVISCRTNFYDFPDATPGGTLNEFDLYFIKDIGGESLTEFAEITYGVNTQEFIRAAQDAGFLELTRQPFFLKLLLQEFKQKQTLDINRVELMNRFIDERIAYDQAHFKLTKNLKDQRSYILKLLQEIALTMELMGRNFLFYEELQQVVNSADDIQLIKYSTAFKNIEENTHKWGFEHNNIQEFLAANALINLSVEDIQAAISINDKRIKPSWLNTLFFLMSIIAADKRKTLIEWILTIEPEVLVKIEPDKVSDETRYAIFERIFNYYKEQKVWLRSNKFSERELALFVPIDLAFPFLIRELQDKTNVRTTQLNAIHLLKLLPLNDKMRKQAKPIILKFISLNKKDYTLVNTATEALVQLQLVDHQLVDKMMEWFKNNANQYIRSALYQLIITAGTVNENIDYFIEGLSTEFTTDRDNVHLMDEDVLLKEGLGKADSIDSVIKLLNIFKNPFDRHLMDFFERDDVIKKIVDNAIALDKSHPELEQILYGVFTEYGRSSQEVTVELLSRFFMVTGRKMSIFKKLFFDQEIGIFEKSILVKPFLDKHAIDFLLSEYDDHNITNAQLLEFYNNVIWLKLRYGLNTEIDYLTAQIEKKTKLFENRTEIDYLQLRKDREQEGFNLYFDLENFKAAVTVFFSRMEKDELTAEELWEFNPHDLRHEAYLSESVFNFLNEFTRNKNEVTLDKALKWLDGENVDIYFFNRVKDNLTNHPDLTISKEQKAQIIDWVNSKSAIANIAGAIRKDENDPHRTHKNNLVTLLWFFIKRLDIAIAEAKILDFTLFDEFRTNEDKGIDFEIIEKQVGKAKVQQRVISNLRHGIAYDDSWRNNANFALENQLQEAYPIILNNLGEHQKSSYARLKVLPNYIKATGNYTGIMNLLKDMGMDDLQWNLVEAIKQEHSVQHDLITYLERILSRGNYPGARRLRAAKYLTEKNVDSGTDFYLDHLLEAGNNTHDYDHDAIYLRTIRDAKHVPKLMRLLLKANRVEYTGDRFNRLDNSVTEALYNIGLQSESNLNLVTQELNQFILNNQEKIKNVNFYYPMIDRLSYQFYLTQTQLLTVSQAMKMAKQIGGAV
jgi:hypothetical protein